MQGIEVKVTRHGPFWRHPEAKVRQLQLRTSREVATVAYRTVRGLLAARLQHPTGRYMASIRIVTAGPLAKVTDGGMVYGPWLEGVGSRNSPVTRFRGYRHWRITMQRLRHGAERHARPAVRAFVRAMN